MEQNKHTQKELIKKIALVMLAVALIVGATISGTLAWLTATTPAIKNTFVVGNIGTLTLKETDTDPAEGNQYNYTIIPGKNLTKDPKVTYTPVTKTDDIVPVDVFVFVKIDADGWTVNGASYSITGGTSSANVEWSVDTANWTAVDATTNPGVYYKEVAANESLTDVSVIKDNMITVSENIVHDDMAGIATAAKDITFTAYAIQKSGKEGNDFDAKGAWSTLSGISNP